MLSFHSVDRLLWCLKVLNCMCLFLAALGLHRCPQALSSCGRPGPLCVAVCGLLIAVASPHGLSCPAAWQILVPRPGMEPESPALAGGFLITGPPGKFPQIFNFDETQFIKFFLLISMLLVSYPMSQSFFPVFLSDSFVVLAFVFRRLLHFEFFLYMV